MINFKIYDATNNYIVADGFETMQAAVWYLVGHTSQNERDSIMYEVFYLNDDLKPVTVWTSHL